MKKLERSAPRSEIRPILERPRYKNVRLTGFEFFERFAGGIFGFPFLSVHGHRSGHSAHGPVSDHGRRRLLNTRFRVGGLRAEALFYRRRRNRRIVEHVGVFAPNRFEMLHLKYEARRQTFRYD